MKNENSPNEKRFSFFNSMPRACSKYRYHNAQDFDKEQGRKDSFLERKGACNQDYEVGQNIGLPYSKNNIHIDFRKQTDRKSLELKKSYEGAASTFLILHNT